MSSDPQGVAMGEPEAAGFGRRFLALVIDFLIIAVPCLIVANAFLISIDAEDYSIEPSPRETELKDLAGYPIIVLVFTVGFAAFWLIGRSPGMLLLGLRAVGHGSEKGVRPLKAAMRGFLTALFLISCFVLFAGGWADTPAAWNSMDYGAVLLTSAFVILGLLGYLQALWDKERRAVQDRATGVRVLRVKGIAEATD